MREPWNALEKRAEAGVVSSSCSVARAADGLRWIGGQTSVWGDSTRGRNTLHCILVVELSGGILQTNLLLSLLDIQLSPPALDGLQAVFGPKP